MSANENSVQQELENPNIKQVTVNINYDMKMKLNGKDFSPVDTDGTELKPLILNKRSYIPVRAICKALNIEIDWDDDTKTILINSMK